MSSKGTWIVVGGIVALFSLGMWASGSGQPAHSGPSDKAALDVGDAKDIEAIRQSSRDFSAAFAKADAKAVAAFWTEQGEYHDDTGDVIRGRSDIEKAFAEYFKDHPNNKVQVQIFSIRTLSPNSAIEEGMLRQQPSDRQMPSSTLYSTIHVRDGGGWKIALSREWGAGVDRLEDLEWLFGTWNGKVGDEEVSLTFARDAEQGCITGRFARNLKGKVISAGTMRIGIDPQRGMIRSWSFDDDGGHGSAFWLRDGDNWIMDAVGVNGAGVETACVNILSRLNSNEITWRSIDRVAGGQASPDTAPIKLTRAAK